MPVTEIDSEKQFNEITSSVDGETVLAINFHASWAQPCIQMNQVFSSLSDSEPFNNKENSKFKFLAIDADKYPDISETFSVSAVPHFAIIKNNTIVGELSGADPKQLVDLLQQFAPAGGADNSKSQQQQQVDTAPATTAEDELNSRLAKLVRAAPVMLFMKGSPSAPQCGFSRQLVEILRSNKVRYGFFDILQDDQVRQGLKAFSDWPTFPQLYVNGELQGGLDIVKESLEADPNFFDNALATSQ